MHAVHAACALLSVAAQRAVWHVGLVLLLLLLLLPVLAVVLLLLLLLDRIPDKCLIGSRVDVGC